MGSIKNIPSAYLRLAKITLKLDEPTEIEMERLATCYKCNNVAATCPECTCFVKALVLEPQEVCPRNLWKT